MSKNTILTDKNWFAENLIEPEAIEAHEVVESLGRFHKPISSGLIVTKFRDKAASLGLTLVNEQGRLHRDGKRYMYTAEIEDGSHPDFNLSLGFWNFNNEQKAFAGALATRILVCKNGLMTGLIHPSRQRHTVGNYDVIGDKIDIIFDKFLESREQTCGDIGLMKSTKLSDDILGKFLLGVHRNSMIGAANTFRVIDRLEGRITDELESPTVNDSSDNSVWRLSNAASWVATHQVKNPMAGAETSKKFHDIIMGIIKPGYRPIGEVDEVVETEAVAV